MRAISPVTATAQRVHDVVYSPAAAVGGGRVRTRKLSSSKSIICLSGGQAEIPNTGSSCCLGKSRIHSSRSKTCSAMCARYMRLLLSCTKTSLKSTSAPNHLLRTCSPHAVSRALSKFRSSWKVTHVPVPSGSLFKKFVFSFNPLFTLFTLFTGLYIYKILWFRSGAPILLGGARRE